jgi:hypothetical protein
MSTTMPTLRADLARAKGRWPQIAEATGINYFTIARIAGGRTPAPQIDTYEKLRGWLDTNLSNAPADAA